MTSSFHETTCFLQKEKDEEDVVNVLFSGMRNRKSYQSVSFPRKKEFGRRVSFQKGKKKLKAVILRGLIFLFGFYLSFLVITEPSKKIFNELKYSRELKHGKKKMQNLHLHHDNANIRVGCEATIIIIRYCDKDVDPKISNMLSESGEEHCNYIGFQQAEYIATLFGTRWPAPSYIFATSPEEDDKEINYRGIETVIPIAYRSNQTIITDFGKKDVDHLTFYLTSLLQNGDLCEKVALISWHHDYIHSIASNLGCGPSEGCPKSYPSDTFDQAWIIQMLYDDGSSLEKFIHKTEIRDVTKDISYSNNVTQNISSSNHTESKNEGTSYSNNITHYMSNSNQTESENEGISYSNNVTQDTSDSNQTVNNNEGMSDFNNVTHDMSNSTQTESENEGISYSHNVTHDTSDSNQTVNNNEGMSDLNSVTYNIPDSNQMESGNEGISDSNNVTKNKSDSQETENSIKSTADSHNVTQNISDSNQMESENQGISDSSNITHNMSDLDEKESGNENIPYSNNITHNVSNSNQTENENEGMSGSNNVTHNMSDSDEIENSNDCISDSNNVTQIMPDSNEMESGNEALSDLNNVTQIMYDADETESRNLEATEIRMKNSRWKVFGSVQFQRFDPLSYSYEKKRLH